MPDPLIMYIIVDRSLEWGAGSIIAQCCHATAKAISTFRLDENVTEYLADVDAMRKVVLQAKTADQLLALSQSLADSGLDHVKWIEQPENILVCLATKPIRKSTIGTVFKRFALYK